MSLRFEASGVTFENPKICFNLECTKELEMHLTTPAGNARFTSHRTLNELIEVRKQMIQTQIVSRANKDPDFSILAYEPADISVIVDGGQFR